MLAVLLVLAFTWPEVVWAFDRRTLTPSPQDRFEVPARIGRVITQYGSSSSQPHIFLIQDLHASYEAQSKIRVMVERLARERGVSLLALEGSSGDLDAGPLARLPYPRIKARIYDHFLHTGRLSGAEVTALVNGTGVRLFGAEDPDEYAGSVALARSFLKRDVQTRFQSLRACYEELSDALLGEDLLRLDEKHFEFLDGRLPGPDYAEFLRREAADRGLDLRAAPELTALADPRSDLDPIQRERILWPVLQDLRARLYTDPSQGELDARRRDLDVLERVLNVAAYPEDLEDVLHRPDDFRVERFLSFYRVQAAVYRLGTASDPGLTELEAHAQDALRFYTLAQRRNTSLVDNTLRRLRELGQDRAVLIAGGFHTAGLSAVLRARGVAHTTLSPTLTDRSDPSPYYARLMGEPGPFERLTRPSARFLALPSALLRGPEQQEFWQEFTALYLGAVAPGLAQGRTPEEFRAALAPLLTELNRASPYPVNVDEARLAEVWGSPLVLLPLIVRDQERTVAVTLSTRPLPVRKPFFSTPAVRVFGYEVTADPALAAAVRRRPGVLFERGMTAVWGAMTGWVRSTRAALTPKAVRAEASVPVGGAIRVSARNAAAAALGAMAVGMLFSFTLGSASLSGVSLWGACAGFALALNYLPRAYYLRRLFRGRETPLTDLTVEGALGETLEEVMNDLRRRGGVGEDMARPRLAVLAPQRTSSLLWRGISVAEGQAGDEGGVIKVHPNFPNLPPWARRIILEHEVLEAVGTGHWRATLAEYQAYLRTRMVPVLGALQTMVMFIGLTVTLGLTVLMSGTALLATTSSLLIALGVLVLLFAVAYPGIYPAVLAMTITRLLTPLQHGLEVLLIRHGRSGTFTAGLNLLQRTLTWVQTRNTALPEYQIARVVMRQYLRRSAQQQALHLPLFEQVYAEMRHQLGGLYDPGRGEQAILRLQERDLPRWVGRRPQRAESLRGVLLRQAGAYFRRVGGFEGGRALSQERREDAFSASLAAVAALERQGEVKTLDALIAEAGRWRREHRTATVLPDLLARQRVAVNRDQDFEGAEAMQAEIMEQREAIRRWTNLELMLQQVIANLGSRPDAPPEARERAAAYLLEVVQDHTASGEGFYWLREQSAYRLRDFDTPETRRVLAGLGSLPLDPRTCMMEDVAAADPRTLSLELAAAESVAYMERTRARTRALARDLQGLEQAEYRVQHLQGILDALTSPEADRDTVAAILRWLANQSHDLLYAANLLLPVLEALSLRQDDPLFAAPSQRALLKDKQVKLAAERALLQVARAVGNHHLKGLPGAHPLRKQFDQAVHRVDLLVRQSQVSARAVEGLRQRVHLLLGNAHRLAELTGFDDPRLRPSTPKVVAMSGVNTAESLLAAAGTLLDEPLALIYSPGYNGSHDGRARGRSLTLLRADLPSLGAAARLLTTAAFQDGGPLSALLDRMLAEELSADPGSCAEAWETLHARYAREAAAAGVKTGFDAFALQVRPLLEQVDALRLPMLQLPLRSILLQAWLIAAGGVGQDLMNPDGIEAGCEAFARMLGTQTVALPASPFGAQWLVRTAAGQELIGENCISYMPRAPITGRGRPGARIATLEHYHPPTPFSSRTTHLVKSATVVISGLASRWATSFACFLLDPALMQALSENDRATRVLLANPVRDSEFYGQSFSDILAFIARVTRRSASGLWNAILASTPADLDAPYKPYQPQRGTIEDVLWLAHLGLFGTSSIPEYQGWSLAGEGVEVLDREGLVEVVREPSGADPSRKLPVIRYVPELLAAALWQLVPESGRKRLRLSPIIAFLQRARELEERLAAEGLSWSALGLTSPLELRFFPELAEHLQAWFEGRAALPGEWVAHREGESQFQSQVRAGLEACQAEFSDRMPRFTPLPLSGRDLALDTPVPIAQFRLDNETFEVQVWLQAEGPRAGSMDLPPPAEPATRLGRMVLDGGVVRIEVPAEVLRLGETPAERARYLQTAVSYHLYGLAASKSKVRLTPKRSPQGEAERVTFLQDAAQRRFALFDQRIGAASPRERLDQLMLFLPAVRRIRAAVRDGKTVVFITDRDGTVTLHQKPMSPVELRRYAAPLPLTMVKAILTGARFPAIFTQLIVPLLRRQYQLEMLSEITGLPAQTPGLQPDTLSNLLFGILSGMNVFGRKGKRRLEQIQQRVMDPTTADLVEMALYATLPIELDETSGRKGRQVERRFPSIRLGAQGYSVLGYTTIACIATGTEATPEANRAYDPSSVRRMLQGAVVSLLLADPRAFYERLREWVTEDPPEWRIRVQGEDAKPIEVVVSEAQKSQVRRVFGDLAARAAQDPAVEEFLARNAPITLSIQPWGDANTDFTVGSKNEGVDTLLATLGLDPEQVFVVYAGDEARLKWVQHEGQRVLSEGNDYAVVFNPAVGLVLYNGALGPDIVLGPKTIAAPGGVAPELLNSLFSFTALDQLQGPAVEAVRRDLAQLTRMLAQRGLTWAHFGVTDPGDMNEAQARDVLALLQVPSGAPRPQGSGPYSFASQGEGNLAVSPLRAAALAAVAVAVGLIFGFALGPAALTTVSVWGAVSGLGLVLNYAPRLYYLYRLSRPHAPPLAAATADAQLAGVFEALEAQGGLPAEYRRPTIEVLPLGRNAVGWRGVLVGRGEAREDGPVVSLHANFLSLPPAVQRAVLKHEVYEAQGRGHVRATLAEYGSYLTLGARSADRARAGVLGRLWTRAWTYARTHPVASALLAAALISPLAGQSAPALALVLGLTAFEPEDRGRETPASPGDTAAPGETALSGETVVLRPGRERALPVREARGALGSLWTSRAVSAAASLEARWEEVPAQDRGEVLNRLIALIGHKDRRIRYSAWQSLRGIAQLLPPGAERDRIERELDWKESVGRLQVGTAPGRLTRVHDLILSYPPLRALLERPEGCVIQDVGLGGPEPVTTAELATRLRPFGPRVRVVGSDLMVPALRLDGPDRSFAYFDGAGRFIGAYSNVGAPLTGPNEDGKWLDRLAAAQRGGPAARARITERPLHAYARRYGFELATGAFGAGVESDLMIFANALYLYSGREEEALARLATGLKEGGFLITADALVGADAASLVLYQKRQGRLEPVLFRNIEYNLQHTVELTGRGWTVTQAESLLMDVSEHWFSDNFELLYNPVELKHAYGLETKDVRFDRIRGLDAVEAEPVLGTGETAPDEGERRGNLFVSLRDSLARQLLVLFLGLDLSLWVAPQASLQWLAPVWGVVAGLGLFLTFAPRAYYWWRLRRTPSELLTPENVHGNEDVIQALNILRANGWWPRGLQRESLELGVLPDAAWSWRRLWSGVILARAEGVPGVRVRISLHPRFLALPRELQLVVLLHELVHARGAGHLWASLAELTALWSVWRNGFRSAGVVGRKELDALRAGWAGLPLDRTLSAEDWAAWPEPRPAAGSKWSVLEVDRWEDLPRALDRARQAGARALDLAAVSIAETDPLTGTVTLNVIVDQVYRLEQKVRQGRTPKLNEYPGLLTAMLRRDPDTPWVLGLGVSGPVSRQLTAVFAERVRERLPDVQVRGLVEQASQWQTLAEQFRLEILWREMGTEPGWRWVLYALGIVSRQEAFQAPFEALIARVKALAAERGQTDAEYLLAAMQVKADLMTQDPEAFSTWLGTQVPLFNFLPVGTRFGSKNDPGAGLQFIYTVLFGTNVLAGRVRPRTEAPPTRPGPAAAAVPNETRPARADQGGDLLVSPLRAAALAAVAVGVGLVFGFALGPAALTTVSVWGAVSGLGLVFNYVPRLYYLYRLSRPHAPPLARATADAQLAGVFEALEAQGGLPAEYRRPTIEVLPGGLSAAVWRGVQVGRGEARADGPAVSLHKNFLSLPAAVQLAVLRHEVYEAHAKGHARATLAEYGSYLMLGARTFFFDPEPENVLRSADPARALPLADHDPAVTAWDAERAGAPLTGAERLLRAWVEERSEAEAGRLGREAIDPDLTDALAQQAAADPALTEALDRAGAPVRSAAWRAEWLRTAIEEAWDERVFAAGTTLASDRARAPGTLDAWVELRRRAAPALPALTGGGERRGDTARATVRRGPHEHAGDGLLLAAAAIVLAGRRVLTLRRALARTRALPGLPLWLILRHARFRTVAHGLLERVRGDRREDGTADGTAVAAVRNSLRANPIFRVLFGSSARLGPLGGELVGLDREAEGLGLIGWELAPELYVREALDARLRQDGISAPVRGSLLTRLWAQPAWSKHLARLQSAALAGRQDGPEVSRLRVLRHQRRLLTLLLAELDRPEVTREDQEAVLRALTVFAPDRPVRVRLARPAEQGIAYAQYQVPELVLTHPLLRSRLLALFVVYDDAGLQLRPADPVVRTVAGSA